MTAGMHPNNAILVIAGDVDPQAEAMKKVAMTAFDADAAAPGPCPEHAPIPATAVIPQDIALTTNLPVGLASLTGDPDAGLEVARTSRRRTFLATCIGSERGALYALVPAGRALSVAVQLPGEDGCRAWGWPSWHSRRGSDPKPLMAEICVGDDGGRSVANGVPPDLAGSCASRQELAQLAFENDSINGLSRTWSRASRHRRASASPEDLAQAYAGVTKADVEPARARSCLDPGKHIVTAILTPAARRAGRRQWTGLRGCPRRSAAPPPDHAIVLPDVGH